MKNLLRELKTIVASGREDDRFIIFTGYLLLLLITTAGAVSYWQVAGALTRFIASLKLDHYPVGKVFVTFWIAGWVFLAYHVFAGGRSRGDE